MSGYVHKLNKAAKYLLSLVNDILDVSKLQAGKVELVKDPFDLKSAIENVCEMQREPMDEKNIQFTGDAESLPYPYLIGDEVRISQVLMNILSNAVKFTPPEGSITMKASQLYTVSTGMVTTTISIADTGCGMTPEFQKHIFDVFTQERNATGDSQKGTGLGMAISNMLITQMGGKLSVESELGVGSCFTVVVSMPVDKSRIAEMPQNVSNATPIPKSHFAIEGAGVSDAERDGASDAGALGNSEGERPDTEACTRDMKLLVAEDNELNADIIDSILQRQGYEVVVVGDGKQAVEVFEHSDIDEFAAILMDAQMPVMDGYEAAKEIRKLDRSDAKSVRIFACTASTFAEDRQRALDSGMDDFLAKPLDVPVMLKKLNDLRASLS